MNAREPEISGTQRKRIVRRGFGSRPSRVSFASVRAISSTVATPVLLSFAPGVATVSKTCATNSSSPAAGSAARNHRRRDVHLVRMRPGPHLCLEDDLRPALEQIAQLRELSERQHEAEAARRRASERRSASRSGRASSPASSRSRRRCRSPARQPRRAGSPPGRTACVTPHFRARSFRRQSCPRSPACARRRRRRPPLPLRRSRCRAPARPESSRGSRVASSPGQPSTGHRLRHPTSSPSGKKINDWLEPELH